MMNKELEMLCMHSNSVSRSHELYWTIGFRKKYTYAMFSNNGIYIKQRLYEINVLIMWPSGHLPSAEWNVAHGTNKQK